MVAVQDLLKQIEQKDNEIKDLRDKVGNLAQSMIDIHLQFANLLAFEIGKLHKLTPDEYEIAIMVNGDIIISSEVRESFRLEFKNYNKLLEYLLCMVRLVSIEDGAAVASGEKTHTQVYYEIGKQYGSLCESCGAKIPPSSEDDDPSIKVCEKCYHDGEM